MRNSRGESSLRSAPRPATGESWDRLAKEVDACTRCHLATTRTHTVFFRGSRTARVLFVGEAPGAAEDRAGVPFVGAAGRRLDAAVAELGLGPDEVGVLNLIKCRPAHNRFDRPAARACHPFLVRQLGMLAPEWLVTLGAHALAEFAPEAGPVTTEAGIPRPWNGQALYPMLHPAAMLHNPRWRERWETDLRRFGGLLRASASEAL